MGEVILGARVLIVCTANRGRSPIAEAILRRMLAEQGLGDRVSVESAGLCTYELDLAGQPANPLSVAVAGKHGLDLSRHVVRPVTRSLVEASDLVIVMETWQSKVLRTVYRGPSPTIVMLRDLSGVNNDSDTPDIAGSPPEAIEQYIVEAERCLSAGLRAGPLASLARAHLARTGAQDASA
jgi:protein-tyrosine phosphatase